jgi:hypothetical protein
LTTPLFAFGLFSFGFRTPDPFDEELVALDLAQRQEQRAQQSKALGIKNGAQN